MSIPEPSKRKINIWTWFIVRDSKNPNPKTHVTCAICGKMGDTEIPLVHISYVDINGGTSEKGMKKHLLSVHKIDGSLIKGPILHAENNLNQGTINFHHDKEAQRKNMAIWFALKSIPKVEISNEVYLRAHFPTIKSCPIANEKDLTSIIANVATDLKQNIYCICICRVRLDFGSLIPGNHMAENSST